MYRTLILPDAHEEVRNIVRRVMGKRGVGRVPLRKDGNESSDPRWPFTLVAKNSG